MYYSITTIILYTQNVKLERAANNIKDVHIFVISTVLNFYNLCEFIKYINYL